MEFIVYFAVLMGVLALPHILKSIGEKGDGPLNNLCTLLAFLIRRGGWIVAIVLVILFFSGGCL